MGFAQSHKRRQRIHIEGSMFSSALTDFTVVTTQDMVPELAEAGGLLDSAGAALSDGHDIRLASDSDGENGLPIDLRGFLQAADPANGGIEFATKISLTDPVAGNDIYLFYGDDDAETLLPTDPLGQYAAYDDDTIFYASVGGGANRTAYNITGTDVGGITAGDIEAPSGLLGTQHTDVGDYSTYEDNPDLDLVNTDWTMSFLFHATTSTQEQYVLGKYDHITQNRGYLCMFSASQHFDMTYQPVRTSYNPIYRLSSGVDVVDGQWHHLAGTFISGTRASVYTEGILRNTTTNNIPSSVASNNAAFQIGTQITALNQPADFSHVTVHSVARSAEWLKAENDNLLSGSSHITGYSSESLTPLANNYGQRIHIHAGMFDSNLTDWTVVITQDMVPELAQDNWILDPDGVAKADLGDLRVYLDSEFTVQAPFDLRRFVKHATPANREIETALKIPLTDAVAGNDIWIGAGDANAELLAADNEFGQYNAYDDNHFLVSPCGCGLDRSRNQWATTNNGGLTPGDAVTPWGVGTIFNGNASQQYLSFNDVTSWNALLEVDQPNTCEVLARNDNTASGLPQFLAAKISEAVSYQGWNFLYHSGTSELTVNNNYGTGSAIGKGAAFTMVQGTWYHLATTYSGNNDASGFLIYANGISLSPLIDYTTGAGTTNQHAYPFLVGARGWGKPNSQREWDGVLDEFRMSSVVRSADWIAANHNNFMTGDTLFTGYSYVPALGAVIPYSGNEAAYEAFDSVDGGYYDNHANSPFELQAPVAIYDPASPNTVIKMRVYLDSTSTASEYFWGSGSTDTGQMRYNQSDFIYFRDDSNNLQAFDLRPYKDDSWHDLEFTLISQQATATIDGQPVSKGTANPFTDIITMSVLLGFRVASPAAGLDLNQLNKMEIWKDGNLIHAYHFEHTNAAGDLGPDFVLDRIGGNHGYNPRPVPGNWKRGAPSILNGFNLYTNGSGSPIPAALDTAGNELNIDVFGEPIEYAQTSINLEFDSFAMFPKVVEPLTIKRIATLTFDSYSRLAFTKETLGINLEHTLFFTDFIRLPFQLETLSITISEGVMEHDITFECLERSATNVLGYALDKQEDGFYSGVRVSRDNTSKSFLNEKSYACWVYDVFSDNVIDWTELSDCAKKVQYPIQFKEFPIPLTTTGWAKSLNFEIGDAYNVSTGDITVMAHVIPNSTGLNKTIIRARAGYAGIGILLKNDDRIESSISNGAITDFVTTNNAYTFDGSTHYGIIVERASGFCNIYVNNSETPDKSQSNSRSIDSVGIMDCIEDYKDSAVWAIGLVPRALTSEERETYMNEGTIPSDGITIPLEAFVFNETGAGMAGYDSDGSIGLDVVGSGEFQWIQTDHASAAHAFIYGFDAPDGLTNPLVGANRAGLSLLTGLPVSNKGGNWHNNLPGVSVDWNSFDVQEVIEKYVAGSSTFDIDRNFFGVAVDGKFFKTTKGTTKEYNYRIEN
jgi:hypothetical protein